MTQLSRKMGCQLTMVVAARWGVRGEAVPCRRLKQASIGGLENLRTQLSFVSQQNPILDCLRL